MTEEPTPSFFGENRSLFSDYYLAERLTDLPEWSADVSKPFQRALEIYRENKALLPEMKEAQTEKEFIQPILLDVLGFEYDVQRSEKRSGRVNIPDYILFGNRTALKDAQAHRNEPGKYYSDALALSDAKYWERPLDGTGVAEKDRLTNANPSFQIVNYLTFTGLDWGILTNGSEWRLYSMKSRSRIDSYFEVDLKRILEEEDEEQFKYFYHFFRAGAFREDAETGQHFLGSVLSGSIDYGTRLEGRLKELIFDDIFLTLAKGFTKYRANEARIEQENGETLQEIYQGTLRLLYRLLFLLHAESRRLLPLDNRGYRQYSLMELKKNIADRMDKGIPQSSQSFDVWNDLEALFNIIDKGDPDLNMPRYNGGLFRGDHPKNRFLAGHKISDKYMVPALELLTREPDPQTGRKRYIDYKSLNVEQLGSIYEGLLEFHLRIAGEPLAVVKERGLEVFTPENEVDDPSEIIAKGELYLQNDKGERKATGSYYTPHYIVEYIVEHTLEPVFEERKATFENLMDKWKPKYDKFTVLDEKIQAGDRSERTHNKRKKLDVEVRTLGKRVCDSLLTIKVCDPAMGSGHFLKEATDKLAEMIITLLAQYPTNPVTNLLSSIRKEILQSLAEQEITIDAEEHLKDTNLIKRMVMKRSIYGVDLNPMAVELAKLSLWLDSFTVGAPLSFLDHHLKTGNSLIGTKVKDVKRTLEIDEDRQIEAFGGPFAGILTAAELMRDVSLSTDATISEIKSSIGTFNEYEESIKPFKRLLDLWISRHFDNKKAIVLLRQYPDKLIKEVKGEESNLHENYVPVLEKAKEQAASKRFFHWELEFPEVFIDLKQAKWLENPGFDVVVGNPPYVQSHSIDEGTKTYMYEYYKTSEYQINTSGIFTEKFINLLSNDSLYGSIIPNFWLSTKYDSKLRKQVFLRNNALQIINLFEIFEDATVDTCILIGKRQKHQRFPKKTLVRSIGDNLKSIRARLRAIKQNDWQFDEIKSFDKSVSEIVINFRPSLELKGKKILSEYFDFHQGMKPYEKGKGTPPQTREMMDEKVYHSESKKNENYKPLLKARNVQRFLIKGKSGFIKYGSNLAAPRKMNWFQGERILLNRILSGDKIDGTYMEDEAINNTDIFNLLPKSNDINPKVFLPIILSKLCATFFKIENVNLSRAAYPKINVDSLEKFPVPKLDKKMPKNLSKKIEKKDCNYEEAMEYLSDENLELFKRKYELQKALDPFKFLNKGVGFKPLSSVFSEAIKYGQQLTEDTDIGTVHHDIEGLRLQPEGDNWLLILQLKHRDPETGWAEWIKEDGNIVRSTHAVYRFELPAKEARYWQQAFEVLEEFENSSTFPGGKTRTTHEKLMKTKVPVFDDGANIEPLIELREELAEVEDKIEKTDWLIDQVVYQLYGLNEEEIGVVEGGG